MRDPDTLAFAWQPGLSETVWENATVRGRAWYKLLDAPVQTLDVTVSGDQVLFLTFPSRACWGGEYSLQSRWGCARFYNRGVLDPGTLAFAWRPGKHHCNRGEAKGTASDSESVNEARKS